MSLLENILYGIVSGFTEFLPVSSHAHQLLLQRMLGVEHTPLKSCLIRLAVLLALLSACRTLFSRLRKERAIAKRSRQNRNRELKGLYDSRLTRTAALPMLAGLLFSVTTVSFSEHLLILAAFIIVNGVIIIIPEYMRQANKDASAMTGIDGILIGIAGALSALPGISRTGTILSVATARGADKSHALNWALMLSVPAILLLTAIDVVNIFTIGFGITSFGVLIGYIICAVFAYIGARLGIALVRYLTFKTGFSGFAYYSWGMALFVFILYLIT